MQFSCKSAGDSDAGTAKPAIHLHELAREIHAIRFRALGCPCEVLVHGQTPHEAFALGEAAAREAWRIERKFTRYRDDSVPAEIHRAGGKGVWVDAETAGLIDFAFECFRFSNGLFDITSGVLRRVWNFDGSDRVPDAASVERVLPLVGLEKVRWEAPRLHLRDGMELDFGGIGKEYAVDRAFALLGSRTSVPYLVNFGGDLRASSRPPPLGPWQVGVERPDREGSALLLLELESGALATSGDSHRFLLREGVRYGHVLDPRTGWPIVGGPRSVTVAASTCTEAGMWATIALLQGKDATFFLQQNQRKHWVIAP